MNESQLRHLVVSFRHIDELLGEAVRNLSAEADASPFARYTQDASPVQRKVVADHVAGIRRAMARIMDEVGAPRPAPVSGALWAAQSQVAAARIAIDELRPRVMRGYGALSDADAVRLDGIAAELDAALERLLAYLAQGPDADLPARLQRLEQTRDEVPLLRELARIVTDHGLVGLRGTLSLLLERLEGDGFEIGVFGRVSSGKSSLLNRLLGAPVLPVGVTPVTAVPTRIRLGEHSRAMIEFAQSPPLTIGLERLPEFSTEQQNPGNRKHVTRILVEVPAGRLPPGVTWVDTPGLGSLATDGAAETDAYLPRCDLGLVLIDAGAVPTPEDFALVQRLLRAGASAMVLVSKADLLDAPDRQRVVDYVRQQLGAQLGTPLAVYPVSVKDAAASLCEAWFDEALQPLLRTHGEQAAAAMRRKIGLFREAVERTLEARLGQPAAAPRYAAALAALRAGDELCEAARRAADARTDAVARLADAALDAAAGALAARRQEPAAACAAALRQAVAAHAEGIVRSLAELRRQLEDALRQGRQVLGLPASDAEPLPAPAGMPSLDARASLAGMASPFAGGLSWLPAAWALPLARARLRAQWGPRLADVLDAYRRALAAWQRQTIAEMRAGFAAQAAPLLAQLEALTATAPEGKAEAIARDLARLRGFVT